jgi:hypothetical protein
VVVDGYKRVRGLQSLRQDVVRAVAWELAEVDALVLERLMRVSEADGALEQGWLLAELHERFSLAHEELARRFDKSQSWVSRRLALVRTLPRVVQDCVQKGDLPAHAAMKYLVPMARAKPADCERLIEALGNSQPSTRQVATLYAAWVNGNKATREFIVTKPLVALRVHQDTAVSNDKASAKLKPSATLIDDLHVLIGTTRRAHNRLLQGAAQGLLPPERAEAQRAVRQIETDIASMLGCATDKLAASPRRHEEEERDSHHA